MKRRRSSVALAALAALLGASALTVAASPGAGAATTTDDTRGCSTGTLPSSVQGAPAGFHAGLPRGYWTWHDATGWHLRVTHSTSQRMTFTGMITASRPLTATKVRDERHDALRLSADHRTATFRFTNYGGVDGVDFVAHCAAAVGFSLAVDGHRITTARIMLGHRLVHPARNPFVVHRL